MTTKEKIARWVQGELPEIGTSRVRGRLYWEPHLKNVVKGDVDVEGNFTIPNWAPDIDIRRWHGDDGLLAEIERRGISEPFVTALSVLIPGVTAHAGTVGATLSGPSSMEAFLFALLRSETAQLAAALIKVIEGEPDSALGARGGLEI